MAQETVIEVELTKDQLDELIDQEARTRLGITGEDFKRLFNNGNLSNDDPTVRSIAMLLKLAEEV